LDVGAAATATIALRPSGVAPVISVMGAAERTYYLKDGFKITTALVPESVCEGAKVLFRWTGKDAATEAPWDAIPAAATQKTLIVPGPVGARHNQRHTVTLSASIEGASAEMASTATVTVQALGSPLVASLRGPSDFKARATLVLSAADSYDPDGERVGLWLFVWRSTNYLSC